MKHSKRYTADAQLRGDNQQYSPEEALAIIKQYKPGNFDETVEVSMRLGVDPRKADQMVRGTVNLPNGTGKTARVLVFAQGARADEAVAAGADEVGAEQALDHLGAPGELPEQLGRRERDVEEEADAQVGAHLAQQLGGDGVDATEVVVETVGDEGADAEVHVRENVLDGLGEHVRSAVTQDV